MPRAFSLLLAGHGWVNICPSGIAWSGWVSRHSRTTSGTKGMRVPRMNESPEACSAIWLASEIIPASATTVTSVNWWAVLNALMTTSMVAVSALLPSKASTASGKPGGVGEQTDGDLRFEFAFLGEAGLTESVTSIGFEVQRGDVVEHQRRRSQPGAGRACC